MFCFVFKSHFIFLVKNSGEHLTVFKYSSLGFALSMEPAWDSISLFPSLPLPLSHLPSLKLKKNIFIPKCTRYRISKYDLCALIKGSLCFQTSSEKWRLGGVLKLSDRGGIFIVIFNSAQLFQVAFHSPNFFWKVHVLERCHLNSTITSPLQGSELVTVCISQKNTTRTF